jgi:hypothetical protein
MPFFSFSNLQLWKMRKVLLLSLNGYGALMCLNAATIFDYSFYSLVRMFEMRSKRELTTTNRVMLLKDYRPGVSKGFIDFRLFSRFFSAS